PWGWLPLSKEQRWGEPISKERQAELDGYLQRWEAEERPGGPGHGERAGPFAGATAPEPGVLLTGADVCYLAARALTGGVAAEAAARAAAQARLHGAAGKIHTGLNMSALHLAGADLRGAQLTGASLTNAQLMGADLIGAHLAGADLRGAQLA